jgi:hypothetical protein
VIPGLVLDPRVISGLVLGPGMALNPGQKSPLYIAYGKQSFPCLKEVQCSTAQHNTVQCSTSRYSTLQCRIVQHITLQCSLQDEGAGQSIKQF